jgi:hypothetical protein
MTMGYLRRAIAVLLVIAMMLCVSAFAASSPSTAPVNPGYNPTSDVDTNTQDHPGAIVSSTVSSDNTGTAPATAEVIAITGDAPKATVEISTARDDKNNAVPVTVIGDGTNGVFDSTAGRNVTVLQVATPTVVTINTKAFTNSKVKNLNVSSPQLVIKKNAFKKTKTKNATIKLNGAKKASDVSTVKGAFNGLNKKAKIYVNSANMSKKEFNKLKKKLRKAGFKGTIKRKKM